MGCIAKLALVCGMVFGADDASDVVPLCRKIDAALVASSNSPGKSASATKQLQATDAEFVRRVWLDVAGRIPTANDAKVFIADRSPTKRADLVKKLLSTRDYANHWGRVWSEYLTDARPFPTDNFNGQLLQNFLRDSLDENRSYRDIVRDLLTGEGPSDKSGPANFLLRYEADPVQLAGAVSKKFLGSTIQCAECHDHPHTTWKQHDFWGLAAYFARLRKMQPVNEPDGENFFVVVERPRGELRVAEATAKKILASKGEVSLDTPEPDDEAPKEEGNPSPDMPPQKRSIYPRLPGQIDMDASESRRHALIEWLTANENPYFSRHAVNIVWKQLFGRQLTPTLDNVAQLEIPPALELLADDFRHHDFDLRRLIETIVLTEAYQRSSRVAGETSNLLEFASGSSYERFPIRPLTADQLYLSVAQATGYRGDENDARLSALTHDDFSYDISTQAYSDESPSVVRSLALLNGDQARGAAELAAAAASRLYGAHPGRQHVEWLVWSILSRPPTSAELEPLVDLAGRGEGIAGLEDVAWALINSAEFNTNH